MKRFVTLILAVALVFACIQVPAQAAWQQKGGSWYYTDASGKNVTGWVLDGGKWYYMNASGVMVTGWLQLGSTWYYMNSSGAMVTGAVTIGGKQHKFNASGVWQGEVQTAKNGWANEGGKWYYYKNGAKATGWVAVGGVWYYMNTAGVMVTGWLQQGSTWYYMNSSGAMVTGTVTIGGVQHKFNASGVWQGEVQTAKNGWASEGGKWYYYKNNVKATGWLQLGSAWYYLDSTGAMVTGTVTIGGKQHSFNASGVWQGEVQVAKNGWISEGGKWYYYKDNVKATGWLQQGSTWYYLDSTGAMVIGWVQQGGTWYYMNASGAMVTGWQTIGEDTYYFYTSGAMAVNTVIDGVTLGADGKAKQDQEDPEEDEQDPEDTEDPEAPPADATITIGLPMRAQVEDYDTNALTQWLEQQTGYEIEFVYYMNSATDMRSQIAAQIANGDPLPDIIMGCDMGGAAPTFAQDGYFADLTPYFRDTDGAAKNFWDRMNACLTQDEMDYVMRTICSPTSQTIYSVPTITTDSFNTDCMAWINREWLDAVDMEMPTNMDEFYNVLVAFKNQDPNGNGVKDEIPLLGAERMSGGKVTEWLINMFLYYDSSALWQPDSSGQLQPVFTQDSYRQALMFVNRLTDEGLLSNASFSMGAADIRSVLNINPPVVGVLVGNISALYQQGVSSEVLCQYDPIINWGYTVEKDISCKADCFITADCDSVAAAFKVLMTLYSEEGTLRMRFGEKGVDWTDEDVWGNSINGADVNIEVINDVTGGSSNSWWGFHASGILDNDGSAAVYWDCETDEDYWLADSLAHGAKSVIWGVYSKTPEKTCPTLVSDELYIAQNQVKDQVEMAQKEFATGQLDPANDSDWNAYLQALADVGLSGATTAIQQAYDDQIDCAAKGHLFANATCTEGQKCIFCGKTQGQPKGHSYGAESCSRCHRAKPTLLDNHWVTFGGSEEQVSQPTLSFEDGGECLISIGYFEYIDTEYLDMYLYWDWVWINGKPHAQVPSGTWRDGTYTVSGNTVTMEFYDGKIVMTKQSDDSYVVTSADCFVNTGTVFTAE